MASNEGFGWLSAAVRACETFSMGTSQPAFSSTGEGVHAVTRVLNHYRELREAPLGRPRWPVAAGMVPGCWPSTWVAREAGSWQARWLRLLLLLRSSACRAQHCRVQMVFVQPCPTSPLIFQLLHTCAF